MPPWSRSSLLTRALRVPPALLRASPASPPCAPSYACFPSHPPALCRSCLFFSDHPLCLCRAFTRVCHARALPLPLSVVPTLSPSGSPTLVFFPQSLSLSSPEMPSFTVWGGGFTCRLDCGPARGRVRRWPLGFDDRDVPHAARTSEVVHSSRRGNPRPEQPRWHSTPPLAVRDRHYVQDPRRRSWECCPASCHRPSYSTSTPVLYPNTCITASC